MTIINNILDVENLISDIDLVLFDLDDTLYSEKDYVKSGFKAVDSKLFDKLWEAFEKGLPVFDSVIPERKEEALKIYRNHIPDISLYSGVTDMLGRIRKSGKHLGIITDGRPEGQRAKIKALGLEGLVDKIIVTDELGGSEFRKPNKLAFELMQSYFNVPFDKIVYIGDNLKKDFVAPELLGMKAIFFKNPDGLY